MTITFYTNPMSRGQIARWALHEAGADYDQVLLDYGTTMKDDAYLAVNPMGKVPAIVHDGKIVTECAAICAYLADTFPDAGLAPNDAERADYYRWLFFAAGPVESAMAHQMLELDVDSEKEMMLGYGNFDRVIDVLDEKLSNSDYICGDRFTMADVYVGSHVDWGLAFGSMPERDSFHAYAKRIQDRENYQSSKAVDNALMPEEVAS